MKIMSRFLSPSLENLIFPDYGNVRGMGGVRSAARPRRLATSSVGHGAFALPAATGLLLAHFSSCLASKIIGTGRNKFGMDGACLELSGKKVAQDLPAGAEDLSLIHRAQAGDRAAFDELVRLYDREVLRLALRVIGSEQEAADVYQEVFLKVYRSLVRFRFQSSFSTWLYRVVMNVCLDHLRRQKRRVEVQSPASEDGKSEFFQAVPEDRATLDPERALRAKEINGRILQALECLSPRERMVFELRHYEGLKLRAIGEMCGTTEETTKNCLFRATQKLRLALGDLI
jgi:RNA polymerase sigma-70 factor, ECF subfamily